MTIIKKNNDIKFYQNELLHGRFSGLKAEIEIVERGP
jgi:hypothetical protein